MSAVGGLYLLGAQALWGPLNTFPFRGPSFGGWGSDGFGICTGRLNASLLTVTQMHRHTCGDSHPLAGGPHGSGACGASAPPAPGF